MKSRPDHLLLYLLSTNFIFHYVSAVDFVFNGFDISDISLYGNASLQSRILTLTNDTHFSIGRSLYGSKIRTKLPNSSYVLPFSTSFIFAMVPYQNSLPGHGIVFLFVPFTGVSGASSAQHLGLFNRTNDNNPNNHVLGIEFDVFKNQEFNDMSDNHVGIDVNSLTSVASQDAGYWFGETDDVKSFKKLKLNNGENYQVWIDYADSSISVTMAPVGLIRPHYPLLNVSLNLSQIFDDEMYVGFTAATGQLIESHKILAWSFSNSNSLIGEKLITAGLPSFVLPKSPIFKHKGFIAGITVGSFLFICTCSVFALFLIKRKMRKVRGRENMEEWELEYWPHRITYQKIEAATKGFAEENVIGVGGSGKVYKGVLEGGAEIAVKRIAHDNDQGMREFLAEISSLGRLKHRSLVGLRGWCKQEKGSFMLVYDYMVNGSLAKKLFDSELNETLSYKDRIRVLKDVAHGVLYLHEGWEARVLHRDIKSSNVLLDKDMNGRLGDFGLARMHGHGQVASTTRVVGTVGYMAPEILHTGRASSQTDVFGFGMLVLEVLCGKRPIEEGKVPLVNWVWQLMVQGRLVSALDENLKAKGGFEEEEVERILQMGLLCAYPNPSARPTMRQVVRVLDGKIDKGESESEDMDVYLLQKMQSKDMWSMFSKDSNRGSHPTFDDVRQSLSSSICLSWSDVQAR